MYDYNLFLYNVIAHVEEDAMIQIHKSNDDLIIRGQQFDIKDTAEINEYKLAQVECIMINTDDEDDPYLKIIIEVE